jgi:hypothetical protein
MRLPGPPRPVPLHRSPAAFAPPETIAAWGQVIRRLPAASLPARPTSRLKRSDPRQSKQGLLARPILSLPVWACHGAGTPLMIPAPHYPGPLPSSVRSSLSSTVRSSSHAPAPRQPHRRPITSSNPHVVYSRGLCRPLRGLLSWAMPAPRWRSRPPYRLEALDPMSPANSAPSPLRACISAGYSIDSHPQPQRLPSQTPSRILNLSLPRLRPKSPSS